MSGYLSDRRVQNGGIRFRCLTLGSLLWSGFGRSLSAIHTRYYDLKRCRRATPDTIGYRFGSMSIAEIGIEVGRLTLEQKRCLLARFVFELTLVGRDTYVPESEEAAAQRQLIGMDH